MTCQTPAKRKLSNDVLAALLDARELGEHEVVEHLVQALEFMAEGDEDDDNLCVAYQKLVSPKQRIGLQ